MTRLRFTCRLRACMILRRMIMVLVASPLVFMQRRLVRVMCPNIMRLRILLSMILSVRRVLVLCRIVILLLLLVMIRVVGLSVVLRRLTLCLLLMIRMSMMGLPCPIRRALMVPIHLMRNRRSLLCVLRMSVGLMLCVLLCPTWVPACLSAWLNSPSFVLSACQPFRVFETLPRRVP